MKMTPNAWRILLVLAIILFMYNASSQELSAKYIVTNNLHNTKHEEHWIEKQAKNTGVSILVRAPSNNQRETIHEESISTSSWWRKISKAKNDTVYYVESLNEPPFEILSGESSFGYVEMRKFDTGEVVESWPLFVSSQSSGKLRRLHSTLYLSNNRVMKIIRVYVERFYTTPVFEETKIYKSGVDPESVSVVRNPNDYLESHITLRLVRE